MIPEMTKSSVTPGVSATADADRRSIEGYQPLHRVAQSYLGPLWVARRPSEDDPDQLFLLRRLSVSTVEPEEVWQRLVQAGQEALRIHHPHVLPLIEPVREGARIGFAYEHLEAEPLRALQSWGNLRSLSFPVEVSLKIIVDALAGVQAVHEQVGNPLYSFGGMSPDSVLVSRTGRTVLSDCGVASAATLLESFGGTTAKLSYSAPEQLNPTVPLTAACDVFSCGVMLWELLASRRFVGGSRSAIERKLREHQLPSLRSVLQPGRAVSDSLANLVDSALAADDTARPSSAAQFAEQLANCGHLVADEDRVAHFVGALSGQRFERRMSAIRSQSKPKMEAVRPEKNEASAQAPRPKSQPPKPLAAQSPSPFTTKPTNLLRTDTPFGTNMSPIPPSTATAEEPDPVVTPAVKETVEASPLEPVVAVQPEQTVSLPMSTAAPEQKADSSSQEEPTAIASEKEVTRPVSSGPTSSVPRSEPLEQLLQAYEGNSLRPDPPRTSLGLGAPVAQEPSLPSSTPTTDSETEAVQESEVRKARPSETPAGWTDESGNQEEEPDVVPLPAEKEFDENIVARRHSAHPWSMRMGQSQPRRRVLALGALAIATLGGAFFFLKPGVESSSGPHAISREKAEVAEPPEHQGTPPNPEPVQPPKVKDLPTVTTSPTTPKIQQAVAPPEEKTPALAPPEDESVNAQPKEPTEEAAAPPGFDDTSFYGEVLKDSQLSALFLAEPNTPLKPCSKKGKRPKRSQRWNYAKRQRRSAQKGLVSGNLERGRSAYCRAERVYDPKGKSQQGLAQIALQLGDGDQAHYWATKAVKTAPKNNNAVGLLGDALALQGDLPGARKLWMSTVPGKNSEAKTRRLASSYNRLGRDAIRRSGFSQARAFFRRALILSHGSYGSSLGLSETLVWLKAPAAARLWTSRGVAAFPKDAKFQMLLGDSLHATGEPKAAMKAWKRSKKLHSSGAIRRRIAKGHP